MNFKDFFYVDDFDQLFEALEDHQPLDGKWIVPLDNNVSSHVYKFNVPGDDCGTKNIPCYSVNIYGNPTENVSISWKRKDSYEDQYLGVGKIVFKGVLSALKEYILAKNPAKISWTAISKSTPHPETGKITNPQARAHVYDGWAVRHIFPDKYIGLDGKWIRRDLYDKEYVDNGYPPVPEEVNADSSSRDKIHALEQMKEKIKANRDEIDRKANERQQAEEERRRIEQEILRAEEQRQRAERIRIEEEELQAVINDVQKNPNGIKKEDIVSQPDNSNRPFPGKVTNFQKYYDDDYQLALRALVDFARDEEDEDFSHGNKFWVDAKQLHKETPEISAAREQRRQEDLATFVQNPEFNPHGIQEGDDIVTFMEDHPNSEQNGLLGKVKKLKLNAMKTFMTAFVDWDEHAKEIIGVNQNVGVSVKFLRKSTPEERVNIQRKRREHEIEQQVQTNRERQERRIPQEPEINSDIEELINHPANPQHLKPGDLVIVTGYQNRGRKGSIVSLEKPYYSSDHVSAYIKFHGSRAARPTRVWSLGDLEKDTTSTATAIQTRQQQQRDRQIRLSTATNGLQIGDVISVATGIHRGKEGRIVSFRTSGQNVSAIVATTEGQFSVNIRAITAPSRVAESFSFYHYFQNR